MIQIGRYKMGFAFFSTIIVFVALSVCAILAAHQSVRPEWPMPLSCAVAVNEGLAVAVTLVYAVFVYTVSIIINKFRRR